MSKIILHKYIPLSNDAEFNSKRLEPLTLNKAWLSTFAELNDPFEAQATYFDKDILQQITNASELVIELMDFVFNRFSKNYAVFSLTQNSYNCMPMWAHYANNHRGYCIEYELDTSIYDRPDAMVEKRVISYSEKRKSIDTYIMHQILTYEKMKATDFHEPPEAEKEKMLDALDEALNSNYYTKHSSWSYEKEFRIIYTAVMHIDLPCENSEQIDENLDVEMSRQKEFQEKKGVLVDLSEIGLRVKTIYVGIDCNNENEKLLNRISNSLGCGNAQKISGLSSGDQYGVAVKEILGY